MKWQKYEVGMGFLEAPSNVFLTFFSVFPGCLFERGAGGHFFSLQEINEAQILQSETRDQNGPR